MSEEVVVAAIAAVALLISTIAGAIVGNARKTRLERELDIYERMRDLPQGCISEDVLKNLARSIEKRTVAKSEKKGLLAGVITWLIYVASAALLAFIFFVTGQMNEGQAVIIAPILVFGSAALLVYLITYQVSSVYETVLDLLINHEKKEDGEKTD